MQGECFLDADTVGNFPDGIGGIHCAALALDYDSLKDLHTFLAALNDADVHLDGISRTEIRMVLAHLL